MLDLSEGIPLVIGTSGPHHRWGRTQNQSY
jgi:hypothetical protein